VTQSRVQPTRAGGALLAVGALGYAVAVVVYVVLYGQPSGTDPGSAVTLADRVAHYQERRDLAHALWLVELLAALSIAIAGFVLHHRPASSRSFASPGLAWVTVGVGAVILSFMYAFMLGGYPSAAGAFNGEPGLFAALNGIATFLFNLGNCVVFLGLAVAYAAESGSDGAVSSTVGIAGIVLCLLSGAVAFGMLMGIDALSAAASLGLLVFLLTAYFGVRIWRQHESAEAASFQR
jgi:hypothetical protein